MKKLSILFILTALLVISSCEKDEDGNGSSAGKVVYITDDINVPTTWYADSIYVIKDHDFWVENTLTIQAGTIIKFSPGYYMAVDNDGTIIAQGTQEKPIVFTSLKDDAHGGDVNKDGTATSPNSGDWENISVNSNGNTFTYCQFFYGGGSSYLSTLEIYKVASIKNCLFVSNKGGKFGDSYYGVLDASEAGNQTVIQSNTFYNNYLPMSINPIIKIDNSNVFSNPENQNMKNTMNGIFINSTIDINQSTSWAETEVPFVINDIQLIINSPASLTLANGVIVKFTPNGYLSIDNGASLSFNSSNFFTSFKDDAHGGDTNGDGSATSPSNGDWDGIYDGKTGKYLSGANILYDSH